MKGVILKALGEMVTTQFGAQKWKEVLVAAELPAQRLYLDVADVQDMEAIRVIESTCDVLGVTLEQAADAFGEHWVSVYSPRVYPGYYVDVKNAREFILKISEIHAQVTARMKNAKPPHFTYEWETEQVLLMTYSSHRGLLPIAVGLIKAVGKRYNEKLRVTTNGQTMRIQFPS